jgi:NAD-dependent SIR2 family protein deacetylase
MSLKKNEKHMRCMNCGVKDSELFYKCYVGEEYYGNHFYLCPSCYKVMKRNVYLFGIIRR